MHRKSALLVQKAEFLCRPSTRSASVWTRTPLRGPGTTARLPGEHIAPPPPSVLHVVHEGPTWHRGPGVPSLQFAIQHDVCMATLLAVVERLHHLADDVGPDLGCELVYETAQQSINRIGHAAAELRWTHHSCCRSAQDWMAVTSLLRCAPDATSQDEPEHYGPTEDTQSVEQAVSSILSLGTDVRQPGPIEDPLTTPSHTRNTMRNPTDAAPQMYNHLACSSDIARPWMSAADKDIDAAGQQGLYEAPSPTPDMSCLAVRDTRHSGWTLNSRRRLIFEQRFRRLAPDRGRGRDRRPTRGGHLLLQQRHRSGRRLLLHHGRTDRSLGSRRGKGRLRLRANSVLPLRDWRATFRAASMGFPPERCFSAAPGCSQGFNRTQKCGQSRCRAFARRPGAPDHAQPGWVARAQPMRRPSSRTRSSSP